MAAPTSTQIIGATKMHLIVVSPQPAGTPLSALKQFALVSCCRVPWQPHDIRCSSMLGIADVCVCGVRSKCAAAEPRERRARLLRQGLRCGSQALKPKPYPILSYKLHYNVTFITVP